MILHVLTHAHTANPHGLPAEWPAQVRELPDDAPAPESPWVAMTREEYDAYREQHWPVYEAWEAAQPQPAPPVPSWPTLDFIERFPLAKQLALLESADPMVRLFIAKATAAGTVRADDPRTVQGMAYLVATGLLTTEERDAILAP